MKKSLRQWPRAPLAALVLASLALAPLAEAVGRGDGRAGGGEAGHPVGGGGGAGADAGHRNPQANHDRADVRSHHVRSTGGNSVNVR